VYTQKPLARTYGQCERLMDMARRSGVPTQMGNQGHSGANYFQFKAWTEAGIIKDVTRVVAYMNERRRWHDWGKITEYPSQPLPAGMAWDQWIDSAVEHPYSDQLHPQDWRGWFDYGCGALGDWGAHILDTCHQFLQLGLPSKIVAVKRDTPNPYIFPLASTLRFEFPSRGELPPCDIIWYDGEGNEPTFEPELVDEEKDVNTGELTLKPISTNNPGKVIYGKDLVFQGGNHSDPLRIIPQSKYLELQPTLPKFPQKNSDHFKNFLLACKGQEETRSPFSVSGPLSQMFALGVIAQQLGGELVFDREKKQIVGNPQAQVLLDPPPRRGWEEFYKL
jgi:hypothetical protein